MKLLNFSKVQNKTNKAQLADRAQNFLYIRIIALEF